MTARARLLRAIGPPPRRARRVRLVCWRTAAWWREHQQRVENRWLWTLGPAVIVAVCGRIARVW